MFLIEDAACAIGSKHKVKFCGTWGDFGCFSFHPRKVITTGEGGMIVTSNPKLAKKIQILRNHGAVSSKTGQEFIEIGYNYRMSELQAAMGLEQIKKINSIIRTRQKIARQYLKLLKNFKDIALPIEPADGKFNFQSFVVLLSKDINREKVQAYLSKKGIETTLGTYAMHAQKSFAQFGYKPGDLPNSQLAYKQTLTLPLYDGLTVKDLRYIAENLLKAAKK